MKHTESEVSGLTHASGRMGEKNSYRGTRGDLMLDKTLKKKRKRELHPDSREVHRRHYCPCYCHRHRLQQQQLEGPFKPLLPSASEPHFRHLCALGASSCPPCPSGPPAPGHLHVLSHLPGTHRSQGEQACFFSP